MSLQWNPVIGRVKLKGIYRIYRHFGPYLRPHWKPLGLALVSMLGFTVMELLRPWPLKVIFDGVLLRHPKHPFGWGPFHAWASDHRMALLAIACAAIVVIAVVAGLFAYGYNFLVARVGREVISSIRQLLYGHLQSLSRSFHDSAKAGDLMLRLTGDIQLLNNLLVGAVLDIGSRVLILAGMVAVMLWMDVPLTLMALAIFPFLYVTVFRFSVKMRAATRKQRKKESHIASNIAEVISSITLVQALSREKYENKLFSKQNTKSLQAGLRTVRLEASFNRIVEVIVAVGTCLVLWVGVQRVLAGVLTPGDLIVFTAYLKGVYKPLRQLAKLTGQLAKASACGERIVGILETEPEVKDRPNAVKAPRLRGEICFRNVTFSYNGGPPALIDVEFTISPGQTVALVGPSGAGKSTVANLLFRFYDPQEGSITLDGRDIREFTLRSLRQQMSLVLQEPILLGRTVRENIAYGDLDATEPEIVAAAKTAYAHEFIMRLPRGYDTVIGERGVTLSGGERHRIAIAQAAIRKAPILILDEPLTGLDAASQVLVQQALTRLMRDKTCIMIGHQLFHLMGADVILVLEHGRIREKGNHQELMARNGKYRSLYELQTRPMQTAESADV